VTDARNRNAGKYLENVGNYNSHTETTSVKEERISYWLGHGAQLTEKAHALVKKHAPGALKK